MKIKIGTQLDDEVYRELKMTAAQERRAISEIIQTAVSDYLNNKKRKSGHRSGLKTVPGETGFETHGRAVQGDDGGGFLRSMNFEPR